MITDENKKLAQWAMDYALKNGCQAAKVLLYSSSNTSFELRDAKMDRLQQASEGGLSLSLYVDGRYGSISTNRLNRKELENHFPFLLHFQSWFSDHLFWNPPGYLDLSQESKQSHVEACPLTVPPKIVF